MRRNIYQIILDPYLGIIVTDRIFGMFFLFREIFPEYKIYQDDYIALEKFRSTYTGQPPRLFKLASSKLSLKGKIKALPSSTAAPPAMWPCRSRTFHPLKLRMIRMAICLRKDGWHPETSTQ